MAIVSTFQTASTSTDNTEVDVFETVDSLRTSRLVRNVSEMVGSSNVLERHLDRASVPASGPIGLATRSDPTNRCAFRAFYLNPSRADPISEQDMVIVDVVDETPGFRVTTFTAAEPWSTTVVTFPERCAGQAWLTDPNFLVLDYRREPNAATTRAAVALPSSVLRRLGFTGEPFISPQEIQDGLFGTSVVPAKKGQSQRLQEAGYGFFVALDYSLLEGTVLRAAGARANRSFRATELDAAIESILTHSIEGRDVWGFRVQPATAAIAMPFVLLALSTSILFRVLRINPQGDLLDEPWIAVAARNRWESLAALAFALLVFGSVVASAASAWVFETEARESIGAAWRFFLTSEVGGFVDGRPVFHRGREAIEVLLKSWLFWCLLANALSAQMLGRSMARARRLGRVGAFAGERSAMKRVGALGGLVAQAASVARGAVMKRTRKTGSPPASLKAGLRTEKAAEDRPEKTNKRTYYP